MINVDGKHNAVAISTSPRRAEEARARRCSVKKLAGKQPGSSAIGVEFVD
jgi:hypothetical protein